MKQLIKNIFPAVVLVLSMGLSSCDILEVEPLDPNKTTQIKSSQLFNKCYANFAVSGNKGAEDNDCDIAGLDGGTTGYVRQLFNANELTTDEAICGWGDEGLSSFCYNAYDASHPMLRGFYYRLYFGVTVCNQYLDRFSSEDATKTAEVRFLRALNYFELLDLYGNVPFTLAADGNNPTQIKRADLFNWLVKELKEIEPALSEPKAKKSSDAGYGRVDKAAAWMLLARLYLNAEVYTGTAHWADAQTYAKRVIGSDYKLYSTASTDPNGQKWSAYQKLFLGDNGESGASVEGIFPILQQGNRTTSYGVTTFLMAGCMDGSVCVKKDGTTGNNISQTWGGNRCRPDLIAKFFPQNDAPNVNAYAMPDAANDDRAIFDGVGRTVENTEVGTFTNGFAVGKFSNWKSDGSTATDSKFPDTDFFFFRVAEAYLIDAECDARLNGGNTTATGTADINALRTRANAQTRTGSFSLRDICDEWSREFYFEGLRRPTLIRFGYFGGSNSYMWQWKGGTKAGRNFDARKNIFAIPTTDLTVNSNLTQNDGY